jgi:hypothetical protein
MKKRMGRKNKGRVGKKYGDLIILVAKIRGDRQTEGQTHTDTQTESKVTS